MHHHRQVVLNVCGTEPTSIQDILMDVAGDTVEFLEGWAHEAMLKGARNIIKKTLHIILKGGLVQGRLLLTSYCHLNQSKTRHLRFVSNLKL